MPNNNNTRDSINWLKGVIALVAGVALIAMYFAINGATLNDAARQLFLDAIPSALVVVLTFPAIYFLFTRKGISQQHQITADIVAAVQEAIPSIHSSSSTTTCPEVLAFHANYRDIDWAPLLDGATSLDIVVCYFDSWIKTYWEQIVEIFRRGGSIRFVMSDPNDETCLRLIASRFPEYDTNTVRFKILNTGIRLNEAQRESGANSGRLDIYFFSEPLNYAAVRIDNESVVFSAYEQFRRQRIDNCGIHLDLRPSNHLRDFWEKEFSGFIKASRRIEIATLRKQIKPL